MNEKPSTLLVIASILFILFGIFSVVGMSLGLIGSSLIGAFSGNVFLGFIGIIATIVLFIGGVLEFAAGIFGLMSSFERARITAYMIIFLTLCSILFALINRGWEWSLLGGLILPALFILGLKQSEKKDV